MTICSSSGNGHVSVKKSLFLLWLHTVTVLPLTSGQNDLHNHTVMTAFWLSHQAESGQQIWSKTFLNWLVLVLIIWSGINELRMAGLCCGGLTVDCVQRYQFFFPLFSRQPYYICLQCEMKYCSSFNSTYTAVFSVILLLGIFILMALDMTSTQQNINYNMSMKVGYGGAVGSAVQGSILSPDCCLCVTSGLSAFLHLEKTCQYVSWLLYTAPKYKYVLMVSYEGLSSHPRCIPGSCSLFLG